MSEFWTGFVAGAFTVCAVASVAWFVIADVAWIDTHNKD